VYNNDHNALEDMLQGGYSPQQIQALILPSSKYMSPDYSASFIDVKLAF